jgi:hypothetical protein
MYQLGSGLGGRTCIIRCMHALEVKFLDQMRTLHKKTRIRIVHVNRVFN